ncbi:hypothetical protein ACF8EF_01435 [Pseudomonas sp. zjy_15]|uniref:hypothetical protein n=1 Tax=Pseudomonas sp. zjy_15 TaxID=3367265 RepID=UPI00370AFBAD
MNDLSEIPQTSTAVRVSCGASKFDNCPLQLEVASFDELADAILVGRGTVKGKTFICAPMAEGFNNNQVKYPGKKTWRAKHLALPRWFAPFDLDGFDSVDTYLQVLAFLERYQGFAYTTASHTPEAPRCRVVLMQTRATDREEGIAVCTAVQAGIERALGVGRVTFDQKVYPGEQPLYTPLEGAETFRFTGAPVNVEAMLMQAPPDKKKATSKTKLEQVQSDDRILQAMMTLGMVRSTEDGERYMIECPFAHEHSMDGGDKETMYCLANTHGHAQANFSCFHAHCAQRAQTEFAVAVLARYSKATGKPADWGVSSAVTVPVAEMKDTGIDWLLKNAPPPVKAYTDWYMKNALMVHPVFALFSCLLFAQALVGASVALKRGTRPNLWMLMLADSEAGKSDILNMPVKAIEQLIQLKFAPAVPMFERSYESHAGLWWQFVETPTQILADEELGQTLAAIVNARPGSEGHKLRRTWIDLYNKADVENIAPARYSKRQKGANEMPILHHPCLSIVGTGVLEVVASLSASTSSEGLTNRFLLACLKYTADVGNIDDEPGPLPDALTAQVEKLYAMAPKNPMEQVLNDSQVKPVGQTYMKPRVLKTYADFNSDWCAEMKYGRERARDLLDIWGRYAEKVLKVAMLMCVMDSGDTLTKANFEWARRFVRWSNEKAAVEYTAGGGGAANELDAMAKGFMHAFGRAPVVKDTGAVLSSDIGKYAGNKWRMNKDSFARERVIKTLIFDGLIEEVPMANSKGTSYRKLLQ